MCALKSQFLLTNASTIAVNTLTPDDNADDDNDVADDG